MYQVTSYQAGMLCQPAGTIGYIFDLGAWNIPGDADIITARRKWVSLHAVFFILLMSLLRACPIIYVNAEVAYLGGILELA